MSSAYVRDRAEEERSKVRWRADPHRPSDAGLVRSHEIVGIGERIEPARALIMEGATQIGHS